MDVTSIFMIIAILAGPIIAVQLTRFLDADKERKLRKISIFRNLMATRAANVSHLHVESLNAIDLEFTSPNEKKIREAWKAYLAHLNENPVNMTPERWNEKRLDLFVDLLFEMGNSLNYNFGKTHLKSAVYSPVAHGNLENDQIEIRQGLKALLKGDLVLPLKVINLHIAEPVSAALEGVKEQKE